MEIGFKTDIGRVRTINEDALLVLPKYGLFAVADGVGGRSSGEIASRKTVYNIETFFGRNPVSEADELEPEQRHTWFRAYFQRCLQSINNDIRSAALRDPALEGMATTAVVAYIKGQTLYITNIGDSRAYLIRDGGIMQLTEDHTFVNNLVSAGTISQEEAREHPQKSMITRALGASVGADPDFYHYELLKGDRILLSTDGLHGEVADDEILTAAKDSKNLNRICRQLVKMANDRGGRDNVTVVLIEV
ncbi:MAG: Stp1/IreP family PP2C-type Ser/Thr phosphatase [Clostridiales Family XIII bacterium]|nr:Stp1/IreP family PP2C-type Ser/Thr phosphatase [Clostridiales Family XIII bacterium]